MLLASFTLSTIVKFKTRPRHVGLNTKIYNHNQKKITHRKFKFFFSISNNQLTVDLKAFFNFNI